MTPRVVVVGAGPAGASAAWHVAQRGIDVTLIDRAEFPRDKVCAECVSPQATRILDAMGALGAIDAAGAVPIPGMRVIAPNGAEFVGRFAETERFQPFRTTGLGIRRTLLDAILVDRARHAGVTVLEGVQVTDLVRDAQQRVTGVRIRHASGAIDDMAASLVIGADGLRSRIAKNMGVARQVSGPRRLAIVAHYRGVRGVAPTGEMHVEHDGYVGIADVGDGVTNIAVVVSATEAQAISASREEYIEAWLHARPQFAVRFANATRITPARVTGPFVSRVRRAWVPGAALVGDAADFLDPFTGEGIYAALRGGELLAPFVVDELTHRDGRALAAYDRARRHEFRGKWAVERIVATVTGTPALMNIAARALGKRRDLANTLIGVTGDFVPAREVLHPGYIARLLWAGL